jgi:hypothetical protein
MSSNFKVSNKCITDMKVRRMKKYTFKRNILLLIFKKINYVVEETLLFGHTKYVTVIISLLTEHHEKHDSKAKSILFFSDLKLNS